MMSMRAARIHTYGDAGVFVYEDSPRPTAGEGEVLIKVHATTVNRFDGAARAGYMTGWYTYTFPMILELDVAGVVEQVGAGVISFAPGDAVMARTDPARNGAYAEYVAVPASEVAMKPASLDHLQAAALPHVGLTAWRALIEAANLSSGQTVLIHAAAGGVGSFAIQLAKWRGAKVIGTASAQNHDFIRELGADEVIDYTATPFENVVRDVDVVFDTVGGDTQDRSWQVLKPGGILVSIVQPPSEDAAAKHGVRQQFVGAFPPASGPLNEIAALVNTGHIKPVVSSIFPIQEIQKAHELVDGAHNKGKLVLQVVN
jgi:NADPH:quinone reductase-like Zn-dependent oxidoreductase